MLTRSRIERAADALQQGKSAVADRLLSEAESEAFEARDIASLKSIWPFLAEARSLRRRKASAGRIDLHTHTTASDGEMTVDELLCDHFTCGQVLINDHNIIDSLQEARRLVLERDLLLDVFLGIEVICTRERRAFEFQAITPTFSPEFESLCHEHRENWNRLSVRFVEDLAQRSDFFEDPPWLQIADDFSVGGSFDPVVERFQAIRERICNSSSDYQHYLKGNQTFDMGNFWHEWGLGREGDPPMLCHRVFASMRCYAMNAYRDEVGNWFDYDALATRFRQIGCFVSHNHPNYWDEDFVGELRHELQTEWITDWAARGVIDALEVWSPPFASQRVPDYWEKVCRELNLVPMSGTDCHSGREQDLGGAVENRPEIPPLIYAKLTAPAIAQASEITDPWEAYSAWRNVLEIDYAQTDALHHCSSLAYSFAAS